VEILLKSGRRIEEDMKFATRCVHAGEGHNPHGAHATPIYQTSTFVFDSAEAAAETFSGGPGYRYIRSPPHTPTHAAFIEKICSLEEGEAGAAFSSGMAAEAALVYSLLKAGDHLLSGDVIYGGTYGLFSTLGRFGIEVSFVDTSDLESVRAAFRKNTKMIFLESPANPTMAVCDIAEICVIAHEAEAICAVDNTFATPCFQRPLILGADAVVESCTKYIGGHGDLLGGVAVASKGLIKGMNRQAVLAGGIMGTHEAWLCLRGLKTIHLRMERHAQNAMALAQFLEGHPKVQKVNYPGLTSHPQHDTARRQMSGFGGMLSFDLKGLGSVDTLVEHPASMTHAVMPKEMRERLGIGDGLVRVSVGIEDEEDILADVEQGLERI
jgi:methionine-gamma-lyase